MINVVVGVGISSYSLISVADEVSVDKSPIRSVLVQTMPALIFRPNVAIADEPGIDGEMRDGISDARLFD